MRKATKKLFVDVKQITAPNLWLDMFDGHLSLVDALSNDDIKYTDLFEGDSVDINIGASGYKLAGIVVNNNEHVVSVKNGYNVKLVKLKQKGRPIKDPFKISC